MPVLEQERPTLTYGPGNPLRCAPLPEGAYKSEIYQRGQELHAKGLGPVADAAFVQIKGLKGGTRLVNGQEVSYEVACLSRDLVWDAQTPIEEFAESLTAKIAGGAIEGRWYGPYQFRAYIEADLDPEELATRMVTAPVEAYAEHMPGLLEAAKRDQKIFEEDFLRSPGAKGRKFVDIYHGRTTGQIRAVEPGSGTRGFVWGYEKTAEDKFSAINVDGESQELDDLTNTDLMDDDMREGLQEGQADFKGVKGSARYEINVFFDPSRFCCVAATAAQSDNEVIIARNTKVIRKGGGSRSKSFKSSKSETIISNKAEICSSCKKGKGSFGEGEQCSCNTSARSE